MKKKYFIFGLSVLFLAIIFQIVTSADTLSSFNSNFFEGFESGSLTTNNWTLSAAGNNWSIDTDPYEGNYNIRVNPNNGAHSIIETTLSTLNYNNITFSFYAYTGRLDSGEYIAADWYNGTDWINVLQMEDIVSYTFYSYNLTIDANNNSYFKIRFRCIANVPNEDCQVDNINVTGISTIDNCNYSGSGNWEINCSDNCSISSNVNLLGNNISIIGTGTFSTISSITNFVDLYIAGTSATNRCEVYCSNGGCFKS